MKKRIMQAIDETERMKARAERYSPEFRDKALIAFCEAHLVTLSEMLKSSND